MFISTTTTTATFGMIHSATHVLIGIFLTGLVLVSITTILVDFTIHGEVGASV